MAEFEPNCEETLAEIQRFLDGELDATAKIGIEQHLTGCSPCMQRAEFRRHLKVMISSKCGGDVVPDSLRAKVLNVIGDVGTRPH